MKLVEYICGRSIEDVLHIMYIEEGKSIRDIAKELDVHYHTVNTWLKLAGINVRLPQEKMLELIEIKRKLKEND